MNTQERFNQSQKDIGGNLPTDDKLAMLKLYALYKQATQGDAAGKRPGITQMVKRLQWDAWKELEGTAKESAMEQYSNFVDGLINTQTT